ncbi:MAG TPA: Zn-dependent hydrolase [Bacteroidales bacterium]|nr:Zn-dependent hydrolase [Bacteroidales bacterium]HRZ48604.1 Zn-dependent hydrolase [Bacteroidales bacterium]
MKTKYFVMMLAAASLIMMAFRADQPVQDRLKKYAEVTLTSDISHLSPAEKEMLVHLFEAAKIMDDLYWKQAYGDKAALMKQLKTAPEKQFAAINYGPWDRLAGNEPWLKGAKAKPKGAGFYPSDMTAEEFEKLDNPDKTSLYTVIQRDKSKVLTVVPYHIAYAQELQKAAEHLVAAANLCPDPAFAEYLTLRAEALVTDQYQSSDFAWLKAKGSNIDFVIGAIENYEDGLFGYKAAYEAFILIKDHKWSEMLQKFNAFLPEMQNLLPVPDEYRREMPGTDADINVYDAVFYAGDCNAGSKTIAINLPNDEQVQLEAGSRKLQLKNSMQAKFDKILMPIATVVIHPDQIRHVKFEAFFANTMFHEIAHGMGIKNTINGSGTIRTVLKEAYSPIEENKADVLGLWLVTQMVDRGELEGEMMDYYVTFMAGIFRSSRFGAASAHGKANMMRYHFLQRRGAFTIDENGYYVINPDVMREAIQELVAEILIMQGNGDYVGASNLVKTEGVVPKELQTALQKINSKNIPVDIVFKQGPEVLGLSK